MSWNSLYGREPSVSSNKKWLSLYHLQYSCCLCQDEEMRSQAGSRGRRPPCGTLCTEAQRELLSGSQWQLRRARLRVGPLPGRGVRGVPRPHLGVSLPPRRAPRPQRAPALPPELETVPPCYGRSTLDRGFRWFSYIQWPGLQGCHYKMPDINLKRLRERCG